MEIKVSKDSFAQSAKILAKLVDARFGKQGQGSLAAAREMLARSLKFDSAHGAEQFLAQASPAGEASAHQPALPASAAAEAGPIGYAHMPLDERLHAYNELVDACASLDYSSMWGDRARALMRVAVLAEEALWVADDSRLGAAESERAQVHKASLRALLDIDALCKASLLIGAGPTQRELDDYFMSWPGCDPSRRPGQEEAVRQQHAHLTGMAGRVLDRAEGFEAMGSDVLLSARGMDALSQKLFGVFLEEAEKTEHFGGTWLGERRFARIAQRLALRRAGANRAQQDLSVWGFLQASLACSVSSERASALSCLLAICAMPTALRREACEQVELGVSTWGSWGIEQKMNAATSLTPWQRVQMSQSGVVAPMDAKQAAKDPA